MNAVLTGFNGKLPRHPPRLGVLRTTVLARIQTSTEVRCYDCKHVPNGTGAILALDKYTS